MAEIKIDPLLEGVSKFSLMLSRTGSPYSLLQIGKVVLEVEACDLVIPEGFKGEAVELYEYDGREFWTVNYVRGKKNVRKKRRNRQKRVGSNALLVP